MYLSRCRCSRLSKPDGSPPSGWAGKLDGWGPIIGDFGSGFQLAVEVAKVSRYGEQDALAPSKSSALMKNMAGTNDNARRSRLRRILMTVCITSLCIGLIPKCRWNLAVCYHKAMMNMNAAAIRRGSPSFPHRIIIAAAQPFHSENVGPPELFTKHRQSLISLEYFTEKQYAFSVSEQRDETIRRILQNVKRHPLKGYYSFSRKSTNIILVVCATKDSRTWDQLMSTAQEPLTTDH